MVLGMGDHNMVVDKDTYIAMLKTQIQELEKTLEEKNHIIMECAKKACVLDRLLVDAGFPSYDDYGYSGLGDQIRVTLLIMERDQLKKQVENTVHIDVRDQHL